MSIVRRNRAFANAFITVLVLALCAAWQTHAQPRKRVMDSLRGIIQAGHRDTNTVNALNQLSWEYRNTSGDSAIAYAQRALTLAEELRFQRGLEQSAKYLGIAYQKQSNYPKSLEYYFRSLALAEAIGDSTEIGYALINIANLYLRQEDTSRFVEARQYCRSALNIAEQRRDSSQMGYALINLARLHRNQRDETAALSYYHRVLNVRASRNDQRGMIPALREIGEIHLSRTQYDVAKQLFDHALRLADSLGVADEQSENMMYLARTHNALDEPEAALPLALQAIAKGKSIGTIVVIRNAALETARAYERLGDYKRAYQYHTEYSIMQDSVFNEKNVRAIATLQTTYAVQQKQAQLDSLAKDERLQRYIGYALGAALMLALGLVISVTNRYRIKQNTARELAEKNDEITRQQMVLTNQAQALELAGEQLRHKHEELEDAHKESERLLNNMLPAAIAARLKHGESMIAERFEQVTVLFADIAGFTRLTTLTTPEVLVSLLDVIFSEMDALAERHGLEKIKTIGDAYMVVAGVPEPRADHAHAIAQMALQMQEAIQRLANEYEVPELSLRIGLHTGPVVAGVIGRRKIAYDLWGDTVNMASRMESHGESGKIHITEAVYKALNKNFVFEERGEIEIKGRGMMRTYFLHSSHRL